jgi:hypothetical protein
MSSSAGEIKKSCDDMNIFGASIAVQVKDFSLYIFRIFCLLRYFFSILKIIGQGTSLPEN